MKKHGNKKIKKHWKINGAKGGMRADEKRLVVVEHETVHPPWTPLLRDNGGPWKRLILHEPPLFNYKHHHFLLIK